MNDELKTQLDSKLNEARDKALDSLSRYKFMNFGYWAAIWVHLNRLRGDPLANPFRDVVSQARKVRSSIGGGQ